MRVTLELPDDLATHADPAREVMESLAIEGYRSGALSLYGAGRVLGLTRCGFEGFLKDRGIGDHAYDEADLEDDLRTLRLMRAEGLMEG